MFAGCVCMFLCVVRHCGVSCAWFYERITCLVRSSVLPSFVHVGVCYMCMFVVFYVCVVRVRVCVVCVCVTFKFENFF